MSDPGRFLGALARALATMALYEDGHPARARALDDAYRELRDLQSQSAAPAFTFLEDEVLYGQSPVPDLRAGDWSRRLSRAGLQRLEFANVVEPEEFTAFVEELLARLTLAAVDTSEARPTRPSSIRMGAVGLRGVTQTPQPLPTATLDLRLGEEIEAVRYLTAQVQAGQALPLLEAEAVVRSLALAMHAGQRVVVPLVQLKEYDQYTTTHSLNVAVLAMALAEHLGVGSADIRAFGIAGLLHDIGKVRIPVELLNKPGKFTEEERAEMQRHPAEGARIIFSADEELDLAAVVAYEHHIMLNGLGYPSLKFTRACHRASRLVHVCDVYDALRTRRPYRDAWESERVLAYIEERAGTEFDPEITAPFVPMMRAAELRPVSLTDAGVA